MTNLPTTTTRFKGSPRSRQYREVLALALNYDFSSWRLLHLRPERHEVLMFQANAAYQRQRLREMMDPRRRFPRVTWGMTKKDKEHFTRMFAV